MTMKHCCAIRSSSDSSLSDENIHTLRWAIFRSDTPKHSIHNLAVNLLEKKDQTGASAVINQVKHVPKNACLIGERERNHSTI